MRLFIGINFSQSNKERLLASLSPQDGRLTTLQNLHLTLEFLGDVPDSSVACIKSIFESINWSRFEILSTEAMRLNNLLVLEFHYCEGLAGLQALLHDRLQQNGFVLENRPYYPHLTLLRHFHGKIPSLSVIKETVQAIYLYRSTRIKGQLTYQILLTKSLS
ncbi:MAG: RNA 2',3'-cyclic phosphodiesterase [Bacilli bacterium]